MGGPGQSRNLAVTLKEETYTIYCALQDLGMEGGLIVGAR